MSEYTDERRPLTDNEKLALEYIRQNPGCTAEDAANFLVPFDNADELRSQIANDIQYLVWHGYVERNKRTQALTVITDAIR